MDNDINKVKDIVSLYLDSNPEKISSDSVIDNSVFQASMKIHMMYGELRDKGYNVSDYSRIKTFGDLLEALNILNNDPGKLTSEKLNISKKENNLKKNETPNGNPSEESSLINLGIDIVKVNSLPVVEDFRESGFYNDNFSIKEIAYCLTRKDPYKCFAGKFAAKEAVVKADNSYKTIGFNEIEILNDEKGRPYFKNFSISVSHEDDLVIAIVSNINDSLVKNITDKIQHESKPVIENNQLPKASKIRSKAKNKSSLKGIFLFSLLLNVLMGAYLIFLFFFNN